MAAVNETITGSNTSSIFTPTNGVSDVVIEGNGGGQIFLEALTPSGGWEVITEQTGHFDVLTPDTAITYRFRSVGVTGNQRVYMGP